MKFFIRGGGRGRGGKGGGLGSVFLNFLDPPPGNCSFFINLTAHICTMPAVNGDSEFKTRLGLVEAVFTHGCDSYIRMIVKLSRRFL